MLKKAPSFVLASLNTSTYPRRYASASRSLRPRFGKGRVLARLGWAGARKAFLNILSAGE